MSTEATCRRWLRSATVAATRAIAGCGSQAPTSHESVAAPAAIAAEDPCAALDGATVQSIDAHEVGMGEHELVMGP